MGHRISQFIYLFFIYLFIYYKNNDKVHFYLLEILAIRQHHVHVDTSNHILSAASSVCYCKYTQIMYDILIAP